MVQNVARITLEHDGYFVLTADDGENALLLSRQYPGPIHVLLTDIVMPRMNGVELSRHISAERPGTEIVYMSGYPFDERVNPNYPLLQKPFGPKQLTETIKNLMPFRRSS